ncbi:MAG: hypothetical protein HKN03_02710 [Acidimicrobiales bacterium]|nr:hypothetical protein [Acidimicrobiales bacterium]
MTTSSAQPSQGATTLLEVLQELRELGFDGQFLPQPDGQIKCTSCSLVFDAADFVVSGYRRVEGASDAADMNIVVWGTCLGCAKGGVLTLGYGPNASMEDEAVMDRLELDHASEPGATPSEAKHGH